VLLSLPAADRTLDRWIDVVVVMAVVAAVVRGLALCNDGLLARLEGEARADPLTGLLNRRGFEERAGIEQARAVRDGAPLAVVLLDLDRFKCVNDRHGHESATWCSCGSAASCASRPASRHGQRGGRRRHPPVDVQRLVAQADRALYRAKRAGRNRTVVADAQAV
jgi:PleD family two-component response regulator